MRTSIIQVVHASLLVCSGAVYGADLSEYEKTCLDLGFKKRTPAYGECVLELDKRSTDQQKQSERARGDQQRQAQEQQRQAQEQQERQVTLQRQQQDEQRATQLAARGDGSPDHQTCYKYGFVPGTTHYGECRQRIDLARADISQKKAQFEAEQAEYEKQKAAYQKKKEVDGWLKLSQFGFAMAAGTSPYASENIANAGRVVSGQAPIAPTRPQIQNYTITMPNGRMVNCNSVGNNINCF